MKLKLIIITLFLPVLAMAETTTPTEDDFSDAHGYGNTANQMLQTCMDSAGPLYSHDANPVLMIARELILLGKKSRVPDLMVDFDVINKRVLRETFQGPKHSSFFSNATLYEAGAVDSLYALRGLTSGASMTKTMQNHAVGSLQHSMLGFKAFNAEFTNEFKDYQTVTAPAYEIYEKMRRRRNRMICERYQAVFMDAAEAVVSGDEQYELRQQRLALGVLKICGSSQDFAKHPMCYQ